METMRVTANGIEQAVHTWGPLDGTPLLLVHGNCSSGLFWEPFVRTRLGGDDGPWRVVAPDLRGYGESETAPVDGTRGLGDFADDVAALLDAEGLFPAGTRPWVGAHSMGGGIVMQLAVDHPDRVAGLLLEAPLSPYGFGGTRDVDGTPTTEDYAGTGAGAVNPDFVARLAAKDRSGEEPTAPRTVLRTAYVSDASVLGDDEEAMLDTVLSTATGEDNYPGDAGASHNWPMSGPGTRGVTNAMSPKYFGVADALVGLEPKPPVEWVRGDADVIVSDTSLFDLAYLGQLGVVPGWPGAEACPPQPMVAQTRAVLERYAAAGGSFTETVLEGCGHSPHLERPAEFLAALERLAAQANSR
ncbi:alpha/beta hydrolase [Knoellia koreensis]|uniref:Alpha/beta hydrolase n=1 Tax=Knoellia koreensis TaxID=2730921 RepID=A0A849H4N7_9MICO|nr:alpha/beta hydrolase [Knoellia sp. DB2414S]NNM44750.1 alpha/beta hydrolase [Knoellia sp. DB2414S]